MLAVHFEVGEPERSNRSILLSGFASGNNSIQLLMEPLTFRMRGIIYIMLEVQRR